MKAIAKRIQLIQLRRDLRMYPIVDKNNPTPLEKSIMDQCKFLDRKLGELRALDDKAKSCLIIGMSTGNKEYLDAVGIYSKIADDIAMDI